MSVLWGVFWFTGVFGADDKANWPHWRGPHDNGNMSEGIYPVTWDANTVLCKALLPGKGRSTPVVWERRIFLTSHANGQDAVLAFDWDGKQLWQTTLGNEKPGKNKLSSGCNSFTVTEVVP